MKPDTFKIPVTILTGLGIPRAPYLLRLPSGKMYLHPTWKCCWRSAAGPTASLISTKEIG